MNVLLRLLGRREPQAPELFLQLEFFPPEKKTLNKTVSDALSRAIEDGRSKVVVRLLDPKRTLTATIRELAAVVAESRIATEQVIASIGTNQDANARANDLNGRHLKLQRKALTLAIALLRQTIENRASLALEPFPGAPFQAVKKNEEHELIERVAKSSHVWVFAFEGSDLFADRGKILFHAF